MEVAVVQEGLANANINQHSMKIELKNINSYFLATFLNLNGQLQCDKKITGATRLLDYLVIKTFYLNI